MSSGVRGAHLSLIYINNNGTKKEEIEFIRNSDDGIFIVIVIVITIIITIIGVVLNIIILVLLMLLELNISVFLIEIVLI